MSYDLHLIAQVRIAILIVLHFSTMSAVHFYDLLLTKSSIRGQLLLSNKFCTCVFQRQKL